MVEFLNTWKELIMAFLKSYPLAGAILGALAIHTYFELKRLKVNEGNPIINVLMAFGGWVILVPIVGLIFKIIGRIWSYIETTLPFIVKIVSKIGKIYENHTILVLSIVAVAFISYFIWNKWWNKKIQNTWLQILIIIVAVILIILISGPIADLFSSDKSMENKYKQNVKGITEITVESQPDNLIVRENLHDSISKLNRTWMNSYLIRDSIGILQNYTDSTLGLFSGHQAIVGTDSLLSYWFTKRNSGLQQVQLEIINIEIEEKSNLAVENGTYNFLTDFGKVQETGEYFRIWKKHGIQWTQQKDIWYHK